MRAQIIAKLVEAGHEDLAEQFLAVAAEVTTADEFIKAVEGIVKKHLPHSRMEGRFGKGLAGYTVKLYFTLQGDKSKYINNIVQNDVAYHIFFVDGFDELGNVEEKLEVTTAQGGSLLVSPAPGSHMAYDSIKLGWRKKKGNVQQVLKHFDTYFGKVKKIVKDNKDRIRDEFQIKI